MLAMVQYVMVNKNLFVDSYKNWCQNCLLIKYIWFAGEEKWKEMGGKREKREDAQKIKNI